MSQVTFNSYIMSINDTAKKMVAYRDLMTKDDFTAMFDFVIDNKDNRAALLMVIKSNSQSHDGVHKLIYDMALRQFNRIVDDNG